MSDSEGKGRRHALNRFYHQGGKWYVEAREGPQGPFHRREEAVAHLESHKRLHKRKRAEDGGEGQEIDDLQDDESAA